MRLCKNLTNQHKLPSGKTKIGKFVDLPKKIQEIYIKQISVPLPAFLFNDVAK